SHAQGGAGNRLGRLRDREDGRHGGARSSLRLAQQFRAVPAQFGAGAARDRISYRYEGQGGHLPYQSADRGSQSGREEWKAPRLPRRLRLSLVPRGRIGLPAQALRVLGRQNRQPFVGAQHGFWVKAGAIRVGRCENDGAAEILDWQWLLRVAEIETDDDALVVRLPFIDERIALDAQQAERAAHERRMLAAGR